LNIITVEAGKLFNIVGERLEQVDLLLDIGCGIRPQQLVRPMTHICCDPCRQYIEHLRTVVADSFDRSYVIINAGWREVVRLFPPESVDTVFLVDVIEHLEKDEANELLKATVMLARRQVAVFTPFGFMPQFHADGIDAWGMNGGVWQEHKSGWFPEDFGEGWDIFIAEEFHTTDNAGTPIEKPYGAMWALLTKPVSNESHVMQGRGEVQAIYRVAVDAADIEELVRMRKIIVLLACEFSYSVGIWILNVLKFGKQIKRSRLFGTFYRLLTGVAVEQGR